MALDLSGVQFDAFYLVEVQFPSATYRYAMTTGFVNYDGHDWLSIDDTQGQVLDISALHDSIESFQNIDLTLVWTPSIFGFVKLGQSHLVKVRVYEAQRNLTTFDVSVEAAYREYYIQEMAEALTNVSFKFVLGKGQAKQDAGTLSSSFRNTLHNLTDNAFDKISGVTSATTYGNNT